MENFLHPHRRLSLTFQQIFVSSKRGEGRNCSQRSLKKANGAHDNTKVDDRIFRGS